MKEPKTMWKLWGSSEFYNPLLGSTWCFTFSWDSLEGKVVRGYNRPMNNNSRMIWKGPVSMDSEAVRINQRTITVLGC